MKFGRMTVVSTSNTFICNTNNDDRFIITSKVYKGVVYF